jgi:hypothetical protein
MDFGAFPPKPLQCSGLEGDWNLVRVQGIGQTYQDLKVFKSVVRAAEQDEGVVDPEILREEQYLLARRTLDDVKRQFPRLMRPVLWLAPVLLAMRPWFFRSRRVFVRDGIAGYFTPLCPDDVVVRVALSDSVSEAAVVSHEHIHLLQHRDAEDHGRLLRSPSSLLCDKALLIPQLGYFFERKEVEARLHECVLSFYRSRGHLPITLTGFLSLLACSQTFGWLISDSLAVDDFAADSSPELYPERELVFAKQMETILLSLRTPHLERRFIVEVLTVMYGNLLRYYGDATASDQFLGQIERPNLYDEIY